MSDTEKQMYTMMQQVRTLRHSKEAEDKQRRAEKRSQYEKRKAAEVAVFADANKESKKRKYKAADLKQQDRKKFSRKGE